MRVPRYWRKGEFKGVAPDGSPLRYVAWGWSDLSSEDAERTGSERAYESFRKHNRPDRNREYEYLDVPLREEVQDSLYADDREIARITRNHYGSLVLNTARVLFIDVDFPPAPGVAPVLWFRMLFNKNYRQEILGGREQQALDRIVDWSLANPKRSFRLYRTKAGYRILFTDRLYDPISEEVAFLFETFHSDRLYRILTRRQECFRARLTPKAWRIGMKDPRYKHPEQWETHSVEFQSWLRQYEQRIGNYTVCLMVQTFGPDPSANREIASVVDKHDSYCCRGELPLA